MIKPFFQTHWRFLIAASIDKNKKFSGYKWTNFCPDKRSTNEEWGMRNKFIRSRGWGSGGSNQLIDSYKLFGNGKHTSHEYRKTCARIQTKVKGGRRKAPDSGSWRSALQSVEHIYTSVKVKDKKEKTYYKKWTKKVAICSSAATSLNLWARGRPEP